MVDMIPIVNIVLTDDMVKHHFELGFVLQRTKRKMVDLVKERLGRQHCIVLGEYRYHVWKFPQYTLYVSNHRGLSIEVLPNLTVNEAKQIHWNVLTNLIGDEP